MPARPGRRDAIRAGPALRTVAWPVFREGMTAAAIPRPVSAPAGSPSCSWARANPDLASILWLEVAGGSAMFTACSSSITASRASPSPARPGPGHQGQLPRRSGRRCRGRWPAPGCCRLMACSYSPSLVWQLPRLPSAMPSARRSRDVSGDGLRLGVQVDGLPVLAQAGLAIAQVAQRAALAVGVAGGAEDVKRLVVQVDGLPVLAQARAAIAQVGSATPSAGRSPM